MERFGAGEPPCSTLSTLPHVLLPKEQAGVCIPQPRTVHSLPTDFLRRVPQPNERIKFGWNERTNRWMDGLKSSIQRDHLCF